MAVERLASLSQRERQILQLRCEGQDYKTIGKELHISVPTVKFDMGRVYIKLNLDNLGKTERLKALLEVYCPLLDSTALPPSTMGGDDQPVVPDEVLALVAQDERSLVVPKPPGAIARNPSEVVYLDPRPVQPRVVGLAGGQLLIAVLLGMLLMLGLFFILRPSLAGTTATQIPAVLTATSQTAQETATLPPTYTPLPTYTPYPTQVPVVVAATIPANPTNVVVVATPLPMGGAIIGWLNWSGSRAQRGYAAIALYPKTLVDANGQLHGDRTQQAVQTPDQQTGLATFSGLTPEVYVVCFNDSAGGYQVGEITIQANVDLRQNFSPRDHNLGSSCPE
jgi:DNA-binding CsgD family transcriptional regulator